MREQITMGVWPGRFKVKAEVDLASDLDVSRGTIRKALEALIAEGLLTQTHGRGTYVTPHVLEQPLADRLVTFSEDLIGKGIAFETQVCEQMLIPARGRVAMQLNVSAGVQIFYLRRVRRVEGIPVALLNNYVVCDRCPGIDKIDFTSERLFHALEDRFGLTVSHGVRTFEAQAADREVAYQLGIEAGDPVMFVEQITRTDDGSVIEFSDIWLSGDRFRLTASVRRAGKSELGFDLSVLPPR
jgi:DNA-binding GntR family transcriptional regulator